MIIRVVTILYCVSSLVGPHQSAADGGVVFEQTPKVGYEANGTRDSLARLKSLGADVVALVPFVWQATPASRTPVPGDSVSIDQLRAGILAAKRAGMKVAVKPHVWVPGTWAGAVDPGDARAWHDWFDAYSAALAPYARAAQAAGADVFFIGTELRHSLAYPAAWREVIGNVREIFAGRVAYAAHGLDDLDRVAFARDLDILAATLYPPMGDDPEGIISSTAQELADRADNLEADVWAAEVGIRSAKGSLPRPWESPAERAASPDPVLQAEILARWLSALDRPSIKVTLIYRWFTDPAAGGPDDTDFTPQNKPAEGVLLCAWTRVCTNQ